MIRMLAFYLALFSSFASAQIDSQLNFNGQNSDVLTAQKVVTVITPEQVEVPDTCTRQVPTGSIRVCRDETRYREQCSWIPSSEQCGYESENVCRQVSRPREVCSGGGSREECTSIPSRTVCTERPSREVCNTNPYNGQETCRTVGGGETCNDVGGGQSCRTVYDSPTCRTEYSSEQECTTESEYRCHTTPGRNDCRSIPYSEEVCGMEMQYRSESYACTRTVTRNKEEKKTVKAVTNVQIQTNGLVEEFSALVSIKETSNQYKAFSITTKLVKEPKIFVIVKSQSVKVLAATAKEISLEANLVIEVLTAEMLPVTVPTQITSAVLEAATKKLIISADGLAPKGKLSLLLDHKVLFGRKEDAKFTGEYPSRQVVVGTSEGKPALSIDLRNEMAKKPVKGMKLDLELEGTLSIQGELLNATKPEMKKQYQNLNVVLK